MMRNLLLSKKVRIFLIVLAGLLVGVGNVEGATRTASVSGNWNNTATWGGAAIPTTSDVVVINSGIVVTLTANGVFSNTLTMSDGSSITGNFTLTPNSNCTITVTGTSELSCKLAGTITFTKNGAGTLILSGANTFTGATTVSVGVLNIQSATALGTAAAGTTVSNGAVLELQGDITVGAESLNIRGTGISSNGALRNISGDNSYGGTITLTSTTTIQSDAGSLTLNATNAIAGTNRALTIEGLGNGIISGTITTGSGSLTKRDAGTWTLSGTNTYTGITSISAGTLSINTIQNISGGGSSLGAPTTTANGTISIGATGVLQYTGAGHSSNRVINVTADGGTIDASGSGTLTLTGGKTGSGQNLVLTGTGNGIESGVIGSGSATLTKNGTGTWTLSGANTYTGTTIITDGVLQIGAANRISNSSNFDLGGGTFSTGATTGFSETAGNLTLSDNSIIALGTGSHTLTFADSHSEAWTSGKTLTINGWVGTAGVSGAAGKIYVGVGGLDDTQLAKISFTTFPGTPIILSTGELVPPGSAGTLATDYFRSRATGNWNSTSTWESSADGSTNWIDATLTPTSSASTITIRTGHSVSVSASLAIDQTVIDNGGNLTVNAGQTLTLNNGAATDLVVNGAFTVIGTLVNAGTITIAGTVSANSGGTYEHAQDGGTIPTANWHPSSTCNITGITSTSPTGLNQTFGNLTWDCAGQTSNILTTTGNIIVNGDFSLKAGTFALNNATSYSLSILGDYNQTGGVFDLNRGDNIGSSNIYLSGNFTNTAGVSSITTNGSNAPNGIITFNGTGSQLLNIPSAQAAEWVKYVINSGSTVRLMANLTLSSANIASQLPYVGEFTVNGTIDYGNYAISQAGGITGAALFTLNSGATLITANPGGIDGSVLSTNMTRTFNSGASYIFNGSAAQITSAGLPATVSNLTINNAAGVTLTAITDITNNFSITSGKANLGLFTHTASSLTLDGSATASGSWGSTSSSATNTDDTYFALSTGIVNVTSGSCITGTWLGTTSTEWNDASNWCGGIPTASTDVIIPLVINQPIIGVAGGLCRDITINNGASLTISGSNTLSVAGNWINNGTFTSGTGTVTMTGADKILGGTASTTFNNLTLGDGNAKNYSLQNSQNVNGTLTFSNNALLTLGSYNLTLGASSPAISGSFWTGSMIIADGSGELRKIFTGNGSFMFPIGDNTSGSDYTPITLNFTVGTYSANAFVSVKVTDAQHPNNSSPANYLTRYWTVGQSGISAFSCDVTASYIYSGDVVGQEDLSNAVEYAGSLPWLNYSVLGGSTLTATGVTTFGDFTGMGLPSITTNVSSLTGFSYEVGSGPSVNQSVYVNGVNLSSDITITPPAHFEICLTSNGTYQSTPLTITQTGGVVNNIPFYVRLKSGLSAGSYSNETIACASTGATTENVTASGTVTGLGNTISTGGISGSPFCAGEAISVPYIISGTYTSGNSFTAQLSDASGSFASPINIGTETSTTAGTISATIPLSTSGGGAYRVRVVSNNPAITGTDNGSNLTVNVIPSAAITPNPTDAASGVCYAGSGAVTLVSWATVSGATAYDVYFGAVNLPGSVTSNVPANSYTTGTLSANTTYYWKVVPINACGEAIGSSTWTFTTAGTPCVTVCDPVVINANGQVDWISKIEMGSFSKSSGASNYSDFTSDVISLDRNTSQNITLTPEFSASSFDEYWKVWIDLNKDGDFFDSGEELFSGNSASAVTNSISIPDITVNTTMRVAMQGYHPGDRTVSGGAVTSQYTDWPNGEDIAKLVDNNIATKYLTFHNSGWVQYRFPSGNKYVVTKYSLSSANDAEERDPKDWTLQGSNDGLNWTSIDTRVNEDFPTRFLTREFICTNTIAYEYYRLNMTNNSGTILQIAELELFEIDDTPYPDPCETFAYGEVEDYTVNIAPACVDGTLNLTSIAGTDAQTVCINTPITSITYAVGGDATGATVTGLPIGVTDSFSAGIITISGSPGASSTYTIKTTGTPNPCTDAIITGSITVSSLPTVTWSGVLTNQCISSSSYTLTGGLPAGGTYSGTGVTGTNFDATTAGVGTKTLTYTYTDANGCTNTATNTITVNALPDNTSDGFIGNTICAGGLGTLTFNAIDATFFEPYTISYSDGITTWNQSITSASSTTFNVAVNPNATTIYSLVSITNGNGCVRSSGFGNTTAQIIVTPNIAPTVSVVASPGTTICSGTSVSFTATSTNGGAAPTYQWQLNGTPVGTNSATYTNSALANGAIVTCVMTSNATPCLTDNPATSNTITMTVSPLSVGGSVSGGTTVCSGSTSGLLMLSGHTGTVTKWQSSTDGTNWTDIANNLTTYTSEILTQTTQFRAVVISGDCSPANSSPTTVSVPIITINDGVPSSICQWSLVPVSASASGGTAPYTYSWEDSAGGPYFPGNVTTYSGSSPFISTSGINNGTYANNLKLTVVDALGCTEVKLISVTVIPSVNSSWIAHPTAVCAGENGTIYTAEYLDNTTYAWTVSGGTIASGDGTNSITVNWGTGTTGNVDVQTVTNLGCTQNLSQTVTIRPILGITLGTNPTVCLGTTIASLPYSAKIGNPNLYNIDFDAIANTFGLVDVTSTTLGSAPGNISIALPVNLPVGTYNGSLTLSDFTVTPVCTNTYPITIKVNPDLIASVSIVATATTICSGTSVTFTATPTNGGTSPTYQWKLNGNSVGGGSDTYTSSTLANTDVVRCVMTSNATPCLTGSPATSNPINMIVNPTPSITTASTFTICSDESPNISLTATSVSSFSWTIGTITGGIEGASEGSGAIINQVLTNPIYTDAGTVQYIVTPIAGSCLGSPYTITVIVNPLPFPGHFE